MSDLDATGKPKYSVRDTAFLRGMAKGSAVFIVLAVGTYPGIVFVLGELKLEVYMAAFAGMCGAMMINAFGRVSKLESELRKIRQNSR